MPDRRHHLFTAERLRWCAAGILIALIALALAWELWLAPLRPGGSWLALKALPLCLPLAGILRGRRHALQWASLLILLYLLEGALRAVSDAGASRWFALGEAVLAGAFLLAALLYVRARRPRLTAAD